MIFRFFAAAVVPLVLAGCASIARGTIEQVQFDSDLPGAEMRSVLDYPCGGPCPMRDERPEAGAAYISEDMKTPPIPGPACITPCMAQVPRNQDLIVTFTKAGYEPQTAKLIGRVSGGGTAGMAGNIILGGAVGAVVDAGTGAALDHYPNPLKVLLKPLPHTPTAKPKKPN